MCVGDSVVILVGVWSGVHAVVADVGRGWLRLSLPCSGCSYWCAADEVRHVR